MMKVWAARGTNDPDDDIRRGVSYLDWGLAPEMTEEAARAEWPEAEIIVYDAKAGGWLPAHPGLCAFTGDDADEALQKFLNWSGAEAYQFIMIFPAKLVCSAWDGDIVKIAGEVSIIPNPKF